jgi:hypothetical protein
MRSSLIVLAALALAACKKPEGARVPAPPPAAAAEAPADGVLRGKIVEKADAKPYSYLKIATAKGEVWTAVPETGAPVGAEVGVKVSAPQPNWESKTLNRKFDMLYMGELVAEGRPAAGPAPGAAPPSGAPAEPNPAAMAAQHQAAAQGPVDVKIAKVAKATGPDARTIEELFVQKGALKEKSVTVRGQVVKFSPGIMSRNWLHLRDGTGSAEKQNNDVTVTTQDDVKLGEVVTLKGTVRLDKDFGAGYAYPLIVEDAKLVK